MKIGDYVRTPQGVITKIIDIQEETGQYFLNGNAVSLESKNYIGDKNVTIGENFKSSSNIIDLIEVGDYVNGEYVTYINKTDNYVDVGYDDAILRLKDIKSIVTKEQFEAMQYNVGE